MGFTQSSSGPISDVKGFIQKIPGTYRIEKPNNIINFTGIDKVHQLKSDCNIGSFINAVRELIIINLALVQPPGPKIYKKPRIKLFIKNNNTVLSQITFYLEDDDHKPVDFNEETINFFCQLIKIQ